MKKVVVSILILILFIGYYYISKYTGFTIPCIFHELTNFYCPGCGITRMFFAILKFDFYQAFRYNPLVFILLICFIIYKLINLKFKIKLPKYTSYVLLVIVILYGILRNIDTFGFLKPTTLQQYTTC